MRNLMAMTTLMLGAGLLAIAGCEQKKMSMAEFKEMMKAPPRAPELDRLDAFVGTWHSETQMEMEGAEEPMTMQGVESAEWGIDNRYLVQNMEYGTDENPMTGHSLWTWDEDAGVYRNWWFDSHGQTGEGTSRYDEEEGVWYMKTKGRNMSNGMKTVGEGTMKFIDDDTIEWTWSEWDSMRLVKFMEMSGVSRRQ